MTGLHSLWIVISLLLFVDSGHAHPARKLLPIPDKLVVLTFDDGNKSDITHVAPLLKEYGFRATFVVTEGLGFLKDSGHYLTWEDIRQLSEDGFEIGNHTGSHPNLERLSKQQILSEIEHIEQRCREHAIPVPRTFVYPGYHHSLQAVEVLTDQGYQFARRGVSPEYPDAHNGARGPAYDPAQDHPLLIPTTGYSGPDWDFEDLVWAVEQATDGKIAVLNFHGVPALDHPWVNTEPDDFASYMKYLHDQGCTVIALGDLAKYVDPAKRPEDPYAPIQRRGLITPVDLKCEYMTNPVGIDSTQPRLTWVLQSTQRAQTQTAYRVLVASSQEKLKPGLADRWDSARVDSDQSIHVAYQGNVLRSGEKCWWKVRAWGKDGRPGPFSTAASFQMGLLDKTEWQGKWIGAEKDVSSPLLRKAFSLEKEIKGATIHVSGLGYYELYLNGDKVGDHVLDPGTTYYHNDQPFRLDPRVLYVTYDVTKHLRRGPNAVGVMLGHGWYSKEADIPPSPSFRDSYGDRPRLILQLNLEFLDGEKANLVTDGSWKASPGPILYNDFCNGETYDARLEEPDWATPELDDSHWARAQTLEAPNGRLTAQMLPPIKVVKTIKPVRLLAPKEGVYVYDFGRNFTGWTRLRVSGPKGAKVRLRHGARIYGDQTLDARSNLYNCPTSEEAYLRGTGRRKGWHHCSRQTDTYILKGKGTEVWEPRFTLHGFRYAEVTGFPGTPTLASLEGRFVRSAVRTSGRFTSSNPLINRIHDMVCRTFMGSFQSMPQDAADRAERVAWLGDPGFIAEDIIYNYDTASFWTKWLNDIRDSQRPDGNIPFVSPIHWRQAVPSLGELHQSRFDVYEPWPCWQSTYPLIAWYLYQYYGDERVLNEHYNGLKKLIDFFATKAEGQLLLFGLGDHMEPQPESRTSRDSPKHTPASLTSTAYYYYDTWILSQVAEILGKTNDAQHYSSLAEQIKKAFNQKFFHPATKQYATGSQTSNALPLYLGLVPKENREAVVRNLVNDILVTHQGHLSTGIVGLNALEQALPEYGRADVMYTIATQTSWPSWGYLLQQGATTLWETWEGDGEREYSLNMKMFGNTEKFFYKDLAGISPASPGYQQISVKPRLVGDLRYARAAVKTIRGLASVDWRKSRTSFTMRLIIPVNSTARIHLPKMGLKEVSVSEDGVVIHRAGQFVKKVAGITASAETSEYITFAAGSGSYAFELSGRD